jgi:hypothetical protein
LIQTAFGTRGSRAGAGASAVSMSKSISISLVMSASLIAWAASGSRHRGTPQA